MGVQHICIHNHKSKDIRNGVEESRVSLCIGLWLGISRSLAIVSVWEAIVRVDMGVGVWSIAVGEWSISMVSISMSIKSRVVQPWVSLWISFSISLGGSWSSSSGNNWGN